MIKLFAVDPKLFSTDYMKFILLNRLEDSDEFISKFNCSKGRVIVQFPCDWCSVVNDLLTEKYTKGDIKEIEYKRAETALKIIQDDIVECDISSVYNYNLDSWIDNVKNVVIYSGCDVDYFISNNGDGKRIIPIDYIDTEVLLQPTKSVHFNRNLDNFIKIISTTIKLAKNKIILVDPYINPKWKLTLTGIFSCIGERNIIPYIITMLSDDDRDQSKDDCIDNLKMLNEYIPKGKSAYIILIEKDKNVHHNRFILTDRCGLKFSTGLDLRGEQSIDIVDLLDINPYITEYNRYKKYTKNKKKCDDIIYEEEIQGNA